MTASFPLAPPSLRAEGCGRGGRNADDPPLLFDAGDPNAGGVGVAAAPAAPASEDAPPLSATPRPPEPG